MPLATLASSQGAAVRMFCLQGDPPEAEGGPELVSSWRPELPWADTVLVDDFCSAFAPVRHTRHKAVVGWGGAGLDLSRSLGSVAMRFELPTWPGKIDGTLLLIGSRGDVLLEKGWIDTNGVSNRRIRKAGNALGRRLMTYLLVTEHVGCLGIGFRRWMGRTFLTGLADDMGYAAFGRMLQKAGMTVEDGLHAMLDGSKLELPPHA